MSRGTVDGLPVTRPIAGELPAIYRGGGFIERFTAGLDQVLAPATGVLDCIHAYLDPSVAPPDYVAWLGRWMGLELDEGLPVARRRRFVAGAAELFGRRGTAHGLRDEIELYAGGAAEVRDPGGVWTSSTPTDPSTRSGRRHAGTVGVVVEVADAAAVNWPALQQLVRAAVPAHLAVEIELRETPAPAGRRT